MRARIFEQHQEHYLVRAEGRELSAKISGKFRHQTTRKNPGRACEAQALAANVDTALILTSLDDDFSPRRLERYLIMILEAGVRPAIVLNKADVGKNIDQSLAAARAVALDTPVHLISALTGEGVDSLVAAHFRAGETLALCGSSGVGKTTLLNRLAPGLDLETQPVRESDSKGRHTTTTRKMIEAAGVFLIDLPGLRELHLWEASAGLNAAFSDISELSTSCKYRDCTHRREPGCAVREAVNAGILDEGRLEGYFKTEKEAKSPTKAARRFYKRS